jgi:hypothetical protein
MTMMITIDHEHDHRRPVAALDMDWHRRVTARPRKVG